MTEPTKASKTDFGKIERWEDESGWRRYLVGGDKLLSVTKVLDCAQHEKLQNWWKTKGPAHVKKTTEKAANLGTSDHEALEAYISKGVVTTGKERFIEAWSGFALEEGIVPGHSEVMVYSKLLGVAGTVDLECSMRGKPTIADLKTGRMLGIKTGWQLAIYKHCWEEMTGKKDYGMCGIHSKRFGEPGQERYEIKAFHYEHLDWCLMRFLCCLEVFKGMYFSKLAKEEWPWLHQNAIEAVYGLGTKRGQGK